MTWREIVEAAALAAAVASGLLAAIGMLRSRDVYASLHCASFGAICATFFVLVAVIAAKSWSEASVKTAIFAVLVWLGAPVSAHAIARAAHQREMR